MKPLCRVRIHLGIPAAIQRADVKTRTHSRRRGLWRAGVARWGSIVVASAILQAGALASLQLVSRVGSGLGSPAGGNGDSALPIVSRDGRYVLFASTANNLVLTSSNRPIPNVFPGVFNVYLRDRTNGVTSLVSVDVSGAAGGDGDSLPAEISTNGQYVLFESSASNLVASDTNNATDVFVRDLVNGTTTLVSASTNGGPANGVCRGSVMTPDGRFAAFVSAATNLAPGDTNGIPDVFVRDLQAGQTVMVSLGAKLRQSSQTPVSTSEAPVITPDGRYVAFYSTATNLVSGATNASDIYVRDLVSGTTIWASAAARSVAQSAQLGTSIVSYNHALSDDGQFVAFEVSPWPPSSTANRGVLVRYNTDGSLTNVVHTNVTVSAGLPEDMLSLDMGSDGRFIAFVANTNNTTGATTCILVWDAQSGGIALASGSLSNTVPINSICLWPMLDPTGRFVAFLSSATGLTTNTLVGEYHLYVRDLQLGTTVLVDQDGNGIGSAINLLFAPFLSADGRLVAFECPDANLVSNDRNHNYDVFLRDLGSNVNELISDGHPDLSSITPNGISSASRFSVNTDGRFIAFMSEADNIVVNDTNQSRDVFVRDLLLGTSLLVSVATHGSNPGSSISYDPAISGDGRYVVFGSSASNLIANDTNNAHDVLLRDLQTGTTSLVSVNLSGTGPGNQDSHSPTISSDGRYVLFRSRASNLAPGTFGNENVFVRDLLSGVTYALTTSGTTAAAMTPDGRFVAFGGPTGSVFVWDSQTATRVYTNSASGVSSISIGPLGTRLAYISNPGLSVADRTAKTNWVIGTWSFGSRSFGSHSGLRFSNDERYLAYASTTAKVPADTNSTHDVYLYDIQTGENLLISRGLDGTAALGGASDSPEISSDGRFVAYRSAATNLVFIDTNGVPDLFLYDRLTGTNTLLSASRFGSSTANNRSLSPAFSGNGRVLIFQSWASDLVAQDFNDSSDVFAFNFPYATLVTGNAPGGNPILSWPAISGQTYRVQYKNNLDDTNWQEVADTVTITGNTAHLTDLAPAAGQRFYRVITD